MLDIIILLLLAAGAIRGYFTGFIIQSLTLVALFAGILVGIKLNHIVSSYLVHTITISETIAPYVSFTLLFIGVVVLMHLTGMLLTKFVDKSTIGVMNRIGGVLFGIFKFALLASVCFWLIGKIDKKNICFSDKQKEGSKLYHPISKLAPAIFPHIDFERIKRGMLEGK
jgi:membrane protein required for colicin V production